MSIVKTFLGSSMRPLERLEHNEKFFAQPELTRNVNDNHGQSIGQLAVTDDSVQKWTLSSILDYKNSH